MKSPIGRDGRATGRMMQTMSSSTTPVNFKEQLSRLWKAR